MTKFLVSTFFFTFTVQIFSSFYYSNQMVSLNQQLQEEKTILDSLLLQKQSLENRWADLNRLQNINDFATKNHLIPINLSMSTNRSNILLSLFTLLFVVNICRFFYWQLIKGPELKKQAISQSLKIEKITPKRGNIFTSDDYPLVTNQTKYQISLYKPDLHQDLNSLIPKLSPKSQSLLLAFQNSPQQKWISLPDYFDQEQLPDLAQSGITASPVDLRYFPQGDLLHPFIGSPGINGLESYYQQQLSGKVGFLWTPKDAIGQSLLSRKNWQIDPINGRNIHLSINRSIQYIAQNALKNGIDQYHADWGSLVIIDSSTAQVIAIASHIASPSATLNEQRLIPVSDLFEPGSIFKPLVVAMALDNQSINLDYICDSCHQPKTVSGYTINNWDHQYHPNSTLQDIIKNSDNIGMSSIIANLGLDNFLRYYSLLALSRKTNIDLPGEVKSAKKEYWSDLDLATASFGQGFAITQIQMLQAFNTLANNGYLLPPRLANHLSENNRIVSLKKPKPLPVFQPSTTENIKRILRYAVNNGAVAQLKPDNLDVCAKSGTAQIALKGSYTDSLADASYVGFSPCDQPKFTMIVTLHNPKTSTWGSSTAAPIWFEIASKIDLLL